MVVVVVAVVLEAAEVVVVRPGLYSSLAAAARCRKAVAKRSQGGRKDVTATSISPATRQVNDIPLGPIIVPPPTIGRTLRSANLLTMAAIAVPCVAAKASC